MKNYDVMMALLTALGKRILNDLNAEREPGVWPNGQEWDELNASSQSIFFDKACQEAGLNYSEVLRLLIENHRAEVLQNWKDERSQVVAALKQVCEDYGDNDWDADLHLVDVIEKHLYRHLEAREE